MAQNWRAIADSEVDPESPVTTSLAQAWRDNPEGIAAGVAGAPRIQTGAYDSGSVDSDAIGNGEVGTSEIASGAVSRSEMSMNTGSQSGSVDNGNSINISLNDGALFPGIETTQDVPIFAVNDDASVSAADPKFRLNNNSGQNSSYDVSWRYINA